MSEPEQKYTLSCHSLIGLLGRHLEPFYELIHQFKPAQIIGFYTTDTHREAQLMQNQLARDGFEEVHLFRVEAFYAERIEAQIKEHLQTLSLPKSAQALWCDLTGGTKPMSLALARFAQQGQHTHTYVIGAKEEIEHSALGIVPVDVQLSINQVFNLKGLKIKDFYTDCYAPESLTNRLFETYQQKVWDICQFEQKPDFAAYHQIEKAIPFFQVFGKIQQSKDQWDALLPVGQRIGLGSDISVVRINQNEAEVFGPNGFKELWPMEETCTYFGGAWLEEYVFLTLQKAEFFDYMAMGLRTDYRTVSSKFEEHSKNEIDIVGTRNGKLYFFEVKSGLGKYISQDVPYKMQSIRPGIQAQSWLLSLFSLKRETAEKCKDLNIHTVNLFAEKLTDRLQQSFLR